LAKRRSGKSFRWFHGALTNIQEMNKDEIINASKKIFTQFTDSCLQIPDDLFFSGVGGKWSVAENADHLIKAVKATRTAYSLPKFVTRTLFGKPNRTSKTYEELVAKYKMKLDQGGKASGRYIPEKKMLKKFLLVRKWQKENERYLEVLELNWTDSQLDQYIAPHPLLGKVTLRELCYFTIYHTGHHLDTIRKSIPEPAN